MWRLAFVLAGVVYVLVAWNCPRNTRAEWWEPGGFRSAVECRLEDWGVIPTDPARHVRG